MQGQQNIKIYSGWLIRLLLYSNFHSGKSEDDVIKIREMYLVF